jgi:ribonuclease J
MAPNYNAPILGTPFTMEFLKILLKDSNKSIPNQIIPVKMNGTYKVQGKSGEYIIEFINMTHSTIHASTVAVHTSEGTILYANDYKLDNAPTFGDKPNYKRLKEIAEKGLKAIVVDCLYAPDERKTPSEKIAKGLLEDVLFTTDHADKGLIISTFSSHIARLKTIVELGKKVNRKVVFLGRSLNKYVTAADNVGMAPFKKDIMMLTYRKQMEKEIAKINKNKKDYMIVCTGHQGEPGSVLDRISRGQFPLTIGHEDHIILSSKLIPSPSNQERRDGLQTRLRKKQARIFDEVHVSGHGGREDLRDLLKVVQAKNVIPSHGEEEKRRAGCDLAKELGYKEGKTVHMMANKDVLEL